MILYLSSSSVPGRNRPSSTRPLEERRCDGFDCARGTSIATVAAVAVIELLLNGVPQELQNWLVETISDEHVGHRDIVLATVTKPSKASANAQVHRRNQSSRISVRSAAL